MNLYLADYRIIDSTNVNWQYHVNFFVVVCSILLTFTLH